MGEDGRMVTRVKEREVNDVATLKALADPLRLAIVGVLMEDTGRPLTVKEIAARLAEPQTKLYRHVKQLEKAGLIGVAGTRLVSGIVESRYVAAQEALRLSKGIFSGAAGEQSDGFDALLAAIDLVRHDFRTQFLDGRIDFTVPRNGPAGSPGLFAHLTVKADPGRLRRLHEQLSAVLDEFRAEGNSTGEDAVPVTLFTLLYGLTPAPEDDTAER